eukprot:COSAG03_NODE_26345_length_259_cov_1.943750_2_plen_48_part_01
MEQVIKLIDFGSTTQVGAGSTLSAAEEEKLRKYKAAAGLCLCLCLSLC